jgi:5-methylcytosine-specific restriction protein A
MITVTQYQRALQSLPQGRQDILKRLHEIEPVAISNIIANELGYKGFGGANLQIGTIGKAICKFLNIEPDLTNYNPNVKERGYFIVVHRQYVKEHEIYWDLEPNLRVALEKLNWVSKKDNLRIEILPTEINEEETKLYPEGTVVTVLVNKLERDKKARQTALKIHGSICMGCGIDFKKTYGKDIESIIEIHYTIPLKKLIKDRKTNPETDLIPLCPNCHAVVHSKKEVMTLKELQTRVKKYQRKIS